MVKPILRAHVLTTAQQAGPPPPPVQGVLTDDEPHALDVLLLPEPYTDMVRSQQRGTLVNTLVSYWAHPRHPLAQPRRFQVYAYRNVGYGREWVRLGQYEWTRRGVAVELERATPAPPGAPPPPALRVPPHRTLFAAYATGSSTTNTLTTSETVLFEDPEVF